MAAGLAITGISAYFIATGSAINEVEVGNDEISLQETFQNPDIEPGEVTVITKKVTVNNTGKNYASVRVRVMFSASDVLDYTTVDYNTSDWSEEGDGCWYYKRPLAVGQETTPLFNKLTLTNPTEDQVKDFNVYVYAESRNCSSDSTLAQMKALY
jgi:hypothetical protein